MGTGICLIVERDVIVLANETASLDRLSDGRLILGIGGGWNAEEMETHQPNGPPIWMGATSRWSYELIQTIGASRLPDSSPFER